MAEDNSTRPTTGTCPTNAHEIEALEALASFGPAIDDETVEIMERSASSAERGQQRRLCLVACNQSADALSIMSIEAPDAYAEMLEAIEAFEQHAEALREVAHAAKLRMLIADQRENA